MFFDIPMAILLGIDLGRLWGQPLNDHFGMLRQVFLNLATTVNPGAIPNQNPLALDQSPNRLKGHHHAVAVQRFAEMALVDFARQGQPNRSRDHAPFTGYTPQRRPFPAQRPGPRWWSKKRKSGL